MSDVLDTGAEVAQEPGGGDAATPTVESIAREAGWRPRDEFTLDPDRWVDAPEYLRSRSKKLEESRTDAKRARDEIKRVGATTERMMERARAEERERLEAELQRHTDEGDTQAAVDTARKLERVSTPQVQPEVAAWVGRNPWFQANPEAQVVAQAVAQREANTGASISDQLQAAETEVRKRFPELFNEQKREEPRRQAPATEQGRRTTTETRTGPKGEADLSPEAKSALNAHLRKQPEARREAQKKLWLDAYFETRTDR